MELFIHDRKTLDHYLAKDITGRRPTLHRMIAGGVPLLTPDADLDEVQARCLAVLAEGPLPLPADELAWARYALTDLLDDLVHSTDPGETAVIAADAWQATADLALDGARHWRGRGKWLVRELRDLDPAFAHRWLVARHRPEAILALAREVLQTVGGPLFEGTTCRAPAPDTRSGPLPGGAWGVCPMCAQPGRPSVAAMTYVDAGGLRTYYEVHGAGEPLVLLHGGLCTVETLDGLTPALAEQYRVYTPERRGHGRTPDVDGPMTYQNMAADTIAFMDALGLRGIRLVGFSDGGNVALEVALRRPDLVAKLVVMGAAARGRGYTAGADRAVPSDGRASRRRPSWPGSSSCTGPSRRTGRSISRSCSPSPASCGAATGA